MAGFEAPRAVLRAGTFSVNACRKTIPGNVKLAVLIQQQGQSTDGKRFTVQDALEGRIQFDHDPALVTRDYDTDAGDFIPPQHDIQHIYAKRDGQHLEKTTGRKEGAEKTVTTRGGDVGEAARTKDLLESQTRHQAVMTAKASGEPAPVKRSLWPKGRKLRSRNDLRRRLCK